MTGPDLWRAFAHDPRAAEHAPMRASDADRDLVLGALGEAYAEGRLDREEYDERADAVHTAKTLGELPGFLDDLVPGTALLPVGAAGLGATDVEAQALRKFEEQRRRALWTFLSASLICWVIWLATGWSQHAGFDLDFPWPAFVMVGTAIPLGRTVVMKQDVIEEERRRLVRRQEKALRKQLQPPELED